MLAKTTRSTASFIRWVAAVLVALAANTSAGEERRDNRPQPVGRSQAGLEISLDQSGSVARCRVAGVTMTGGHQAAGLWVRETPRGDLAPVAVGQGSDRAADIVAAGLRTTVRMEKQAEHLLISGVIEDARRGEDRGVDLIFRLPFPRASWWPSVSECLKPGQQATDLKANAERLPPGAEVLERVEREGLAQDILPVACVTDQDQRAGLALAIPPDFPCKFRFAYLPDPGCLELRFPLGLSSAASGPYRSRAPFRLVVMACDGRWGLRDALRQYYAMYPDAFRRTTTSSGLWLFASRGLSQVPDPDNYAFWEGPNLSELPEAANHKIETYPYIIVGQREITYLKEKPKGYEDTAAALVAEPARTRRGHWTWEEVRDSVETSGLKDPRGRWVHRLRETDWGGNSVTFPLNPSPFLPSSAARPTVADRVLGEVDGLIRQYPSLSGIYVDSLASWGSYSNYRREHFTAARAPLAHDDAGRVYVPNWIPHIDFLYALRQRVGNRLVFANGIRPGRAFCAFACDILGVETSVGDLARRQNLDFYRAVGGNKPFLFLFYYPKGEIPRAVAEEYVQRFVAMGLSPEVKSQPWGRYKQRDADLYARFLPLYRRLDRAGWQPVTHARLDREDVWLERFGRHAPELYFTVYNPGEKTVCTRLGIDEHALRLPHPLRLLELVEGGRRWTPDSTLTLPPRCLRVVQVIKHGP